MNQLVAKINRLSGKTLIIINGLLILVAVIPLSVWLVQRQTRPDSRATAPTGAVANEWLSPTPPPVYVPAESPVITRVVKPYGKIGDAVIIEGVNLGSGPPPDSGVWFGDRSVTARDVQEWSNNRIVVKVPDIIRPQPVQVKVAGRAVAWAGPFTVYDDATNTEIRLVRDDVEQRGWLVLQSPPVNAKLAVKAKLVGTEVAAKSVKPNDGWQIVGLTPVADGIEIKLESLTGVAEETAAVMYWPTEPNQSARLEYVSIYDLGSGQFVPFWIEPGNDKL